MINMCYKKNEKMKKIIILFIGVLFISGCINDNFYEEKPLINQGLQMRDMVGIKLETLFVINEVSMNVKLENGGLVVIKIMDISNRVVSKEQIYVKSGDNILKIYTSSLPPSSYRIGLYDLNDKMLGITDFNKIN
jgi:hypothetical protein